MDRQRDGYLKDMLSDMSAYGKAQSRMMDSDRRKAIESKKGTAVLKGRSLQEYADDMGLVGTDEEIAAYLAGQKQDDEE